MDACIIDWSALGSMLGAIATFVGAGVALYISYQWKNQKESEVIANEAKEYIYNLNKLESIQTEIETISTSSIRKKELIEEYILYKAKASNHANFLGKACNKDITLSHLSTSYGAQCIRYINFLSENRTYSIKDIPNPDDAYLLIEHLLIYALYKNGSIKSWFLTKNKGYYHA